MRDPIIPKPFIFIIVCCAVLLPIAITVVLGVGRLLAAMGDNLGGGVLDRLGLALGILWIVDLIVLVVMLSIQSLDDNNSKQQ
jgi:hypothetical protein